MDLFIFARMQPVLFVPCNLRFTSYYAFNSLSSFPFLFRSSTFLFVSSNNWVDQVVLIERTSFIYVAPSEMMALIHMHVPLCTLHEAQNVTKSIKIVLCSDVAFT